MVTLVHKVFVSVGSNVEKEHNVASGIQALQREFGALELSPVYESQAVGFEGDNFYNMVAAFDTSREPRQIRDTLREIERQHRRVRGKNKFESRTLDLDQLLYGDLIIDEDGLHLPSEEIGQYAFIAYPLRDVAGDLIHPTLGKTLTELRDVCRNDDVLLRKLKFSEVAGVSKDWQKVKR